MNSDFESDIFASDNEEMGDSDLLQPAPPVDFASSAEVLSGEVQRMAQVLSRFVKSQEGDGSSLSYAHQLLTLQKGQQEILELLRANTVSQKVCSVSVQTESGGTPTQRVVELKTSDSGQLAITVEAEQEEKGEKSSTILSKQKIAILFREMKDFDLERAKEYCIEQKVNVFKVAKKMRMQFPSERKVWFRAVCLQKRKQTPHQKKSKNGPARSKEQAAASSASKARK